MKASQLLFSFLISAFLLTSFPAFSQFGWGVSFGAQQLNVSELNKFNRENELPELNQIQLLRTPLFFMGTEKFFLELGYDWINGSAENTNSKVEFSSKFAMMNVAFNLSKNKKYRIFPIVGFGPGMLNLNYTEKGTGSTIFSNFVQESAKTHSIRNEAIVIRLGGGWHYRFWKDLYGKGKTSPSIGIQAGYNIPIYTDKWQTPDGREVTEMPQINTQGFYSRISLQFF